MDQPEAVLTAEEAASVASRYGASAKVWDIGGRRWVIRKPTRAQWQAYKCDQQSVDPTTKADAQVALARSVIAPLDPAGSVVGTGSATGCCASVDASAEGVDGTVRE